MFFFGSADTIQHKVEHHSMGAGTIHKHNRQKTSSPSSSFLYQQHKEQALQYMHGSPLPWTFSMPADRMMTPHRHHHVFVAATVTVAPAPAVAALPPHPPTAP